jgi:hypothetical protein
VVGQNWHETESELPDAKAGLLRVAFGVLGMEENLRGLGVDGFNVIHEAWVDALLPKTCEFQVQNSLPSTVSFMRAVGNPSASSGIQSNRWSE